MKPKAMSSLRGLFNLEAYKSRESDVVESIRANVEFRGTNLWVLIFAVLIASIGLNVNSAAVIIGAMLISPLMGPIIGLGLGVGIYDFDLIKKSFQNIGIAAIMSIITAALYFLITPLKIAHSELLARTTPTAWDVLIAFFGGLAGIIATSSKEKGNVIPGVAIATALIPPLCTAGYGLATGNMNFFLGATYLFFINSVFICFATILIVRYLRFKKFQFVDETLARRVKTSITIVVAITLIPSIYIAYNLVLRSIFENRVGSFIKQEMNFDATAVGQKRISYDKQVVEVLFIGSEVDSSEIAHIRRKLSNYRLEGVNLVIKQGKSHFRPQSQELDIDLVQILLNDKEQEVLELDSHVKVLQSELNQFTSRTLPTQDILLEIQAQGISAKKLAVGNIISHSESGQINDSLCIAIIEVKKRPDNKEQKELEKWLQVRTHCSYMRVVYDVKP